MDDKKPIEALLGCMDRTDCQKCPIFGQCNGTFDSALHVAIEHIEALTAQLAESERQRAAAMADIEKHCNGCTHQTNGEFGCDCEGPCDPTKWRGPQEAGEGGG